MKTKQEVTKIVSDVQEKLKPIESSFMDYAVAYKCIGYGRMIELIQKQWERELDQERNVYHSFSDGKGCVEKVP